MHSSIMRSSIMPNSIMRNSLMRHAAMVSFCRLVALLYTHSFWIMVVLISEQPPGNKCKQASTSAVSTSFKEVMLSLTCVCLSVIKINF